MPQPQLASDLRAPDRPFPPEVHVAAAYPRCAHVDQAFSWSWVGRGDGGDEEVVGRVGEDGEVLLESGGGGGGHCGMWKWKWMA